MENEIDATLTVNGKACHFSTPADRTLLEVLREELQLTGTKYGCGEGACGACTVLVDGKRTFSCSTSVASVVGKKITTIEGLAKGDQLHPVQEAFMAESAFQCGYCTAGMIMATVNLLERKPDPSDAEIVEWMNGHVCRCCNYANELDAIRRAAKMNSAANAKAESGVTR
jgi:aerobic-type carbon monoxide dehydrogenase small subunit (CoxS/CutS family)